MGQLIVTHRLKNKNKETGLRQQQLSLVSLVSFARTAKRVEWTVSPGPAY